jgi:hypothetical protein
MGEIFARHALREWDFAAMSRDWVEPAFRLACSAFVKMSRL